MSKKENHQKTNGYQGFSLIELLVVLGIISVMTAVSLIYFNASKKLYKSDEQSLQLVDLIQEARQRALTQRETIRVEIDLSSNVARLIDENSASTATDDKVIRTITFYDKSEVRMDVKPSNITVSPAETAPVPTAVYKPSTYIYSPAHTVCTLRFQLTGTVVDAGTNDVGANANSVGNTIYIWKPKQGSTTDTDLARAITIVGSTGAVRMWEYTQVSGTYTWKDSQRSSYGN